MKNHRVKNVRGLGPSDWKFIVKDALCKFKASIIMIQESKIRHMSDKLADEIWGDKHIRWVCLNASGSSCGNFLL